MVYVNGTAHIRHAQSGQVYEIDADMLDFESVSSEERSMGPETAYSAVVEHPELGQLTWFVLLFFLLLFLYPKSLIVRPSPSL